MSIATNSGALVLGHMANLIDGRFGVWLFNLGGGRI
jgi:hypothetical protein